MTKITRRVFLKMSTLLALSACVARQPSAGADNSPGASRPTDGVNHVPDGVPTPGTIVVSPVLTAQENVGIVLAHRLAFGPRPLDPDPAFYGDPADETRWQTYVEAQLDPQSIDDSAFEERLQAAGFESQHKTLEELASDHIINNPYKMNDERYWQWFILPVEETIEATHLRAVYSRRQAQEMLVDFWHNHFNVYGPGEEVAPLFASYDRDVIRANVFGNFREFLESVATHPSMLFYLNNRSNSDAGPNENFARELFELYTLGAENYLGVRDPHSVPLNEQGLAEGYVDNDVYEAARCFTGWRVEDDIGDGEPDVGITGTFLYYQPWHDRFNKIVLGHYLPSDQPDMQDGRTVLDLLVEHPGTAQFVARKLCRRFVGDNPPESLVQTVADTFYQQRQAPDQLRQVYRTLFLSPEFRQAPLSKVKRPFELTIGALRGLGVEFARLSDGMRWTSEMMGQPIFGHTPPDGYPDTSDAWASTMSSLYAWNLITSLGENWWSDEENGHNMLVDLAAQTPPEQQTPIEIVDFWLNRLLVALPDDSRQALIDFLAGDFAPNAPLAPEERAARLTTTVELILMTPEFRSR